MDDIHMKTGIFLTVMLLALSLVGCRASVTGMAADNIIPEETSQEIEVYFCPRDNCSSHLINLISSAESYVHCAMFELNIEEAISALAEKSTAIDVKIVIDNENFKEQITGPGVRTDNGNQFSHNKFCVADGKKVFTGSFNPTHNGDKKNNENMLILNSVYLAKNYEEEFQEIWNSKFGEGDKVKYPIIKLNGVEIENYFCPEDQCSSRVIKAISKARKSVYFMTFDFTHEGIADALLFLENATIKGVFERRQAGSKYSQYKRLRDFGFDVKLDNNKNTMHHKVFIIDNEIVITGSFNPTKNADYNNDENMLIIHDEGIANKFLKEFDYVWNYEQQKV